MSNESEPLSDRSQEFLGVFRPAIANIAAGIILAVLLMGCGVAALTFAFQPAIQAHWTLPLNSKEGWCWWLVGVCFIPGLFLVALGLAFAHKVRSLLNCRIELFASGFRYYKGSDVDSVAWSEVRLIRKTTIYERLLKAGAASVLLPRHSSLLYTIIADDNKEYNFDGDSVKKLKDFAVILDAVASRFSLVWENKEVQR